jgi:hypothetical protein
VDESVFDALARRAAETMDRKRSIGVLSGAAIVAVARPQQASAGKHGTKGNTCVKQRGQCLDFVKDVICSRVPTAPKEGISSRIAAPEPFFDCVTTLTACCDAFSLCDAAPGFACLTQRRVAAVAN